MSIGKNIKKIRRFKEITQEELSEKLAMSVQAYSKLENGETRLDTDRLEQIAQILGVSAQEILDLEHKNLIFGQLNNLDNSQNNTINLNSENQKLINLFEKTIQEKGEEILFLREQIKAQNEQIRILNEQIQAHNNHQ